MAVIGRRNIATDELTGFRRPTAAKERNPDRLLHPLSNRGMTLHGRLPTAIQSLQFLHQWSWKGLVRSPKAAARKEHGTDHDSLWPIALCLDQFSPTVPLLPVGTMPRANAAPNPPIVQAPMPAPGPFANNRSEYWTITARPIAPAPSADVSPATGAVR